MEQAIGLITGGAEDVGDAQDPSRTIASERALNGAIVAADISQSFEEYLEIFDHFYAEDIEGTTDTMKEPVHGQAAVRTRLAGFLIPLHVFAEIGAACPYLGCLTAPTLQTICTIVLLVAGGPRSLRPAASGRAKDRLGEVRRSSVRIVG